jgi:hypothetical protein
MFTMFDHFLRLRKGMNLTRFAIFVLFARIAMRWFIDESLLLQSRKFGPF